MCKKPLKGLHLRAAVLRVEHRQLPALRCEAPQRGAKRLQVANRDRRVKLPRSPLGLGLGLRFGLGLR